MTGWRDAGRLFYRATCPRCRVLSRVALVLALGRIRRVPLDSPEADVLVREGRLPRGKLAFVGRGGTGLGWGVVPVMAAALLTTPLRLKGQSGRR